MDRFKGIQFLEIFCSQIFSNQFYFLDYSQLASGHYVCPTCQTSMIDMTKLWDYLDTQAQNLPVPKSHENSIVDIFCNDCFKVSLISFASSTYLRIRNRNSKNHLVFIFFFSAINGEIPFHWIEVCQLRRI